MVSFFGVISDGKIKKFCRNYMDTCKFIDLVLASQFLLMSAVLLQMGYICRNTLALMKSGKIHSERRKIFSYLQIERSHFVNPLSSFLGDVLGRSYGEHYTVKKMKFQLICRLQSCLTISSSRVEICYLKLVIKLADH